VAKIMVGALVVVGLAISPALATNYHDYHPRADAGILTFRSEPDAHYHVLQRFQPGAAHPDLAVRGYGGISHPDYGLYTPHFC
jgi:hypothetical protein